MVDLIRARECLREISNVAYGRSDDGVDAKWYSASSCSNAREELAADCSVWTCYRLDLNVSKIIIDPECLGGVGGGVYVPGGAI